MSNIVLLVVIGILAGMMAYGYMKGCINIALSLATYVVAIIASMILVGPVSQILTEKTPLYNSIEDNISVYLEEYMGDQMGATVSNIKEDYLKEVLKDVPLPKSVTDSVAKNCSEKNIKELGVSNVGEYISRELTKTIINAISYVLVFITISIALNIVVRAFDIISKLPIINEVNKMAGVAIGFVLGIFIVWLLGLLVTAFAGTDGGQEILKQVSDNSVLSWIYENNPLFNIFF